MYASSPPNVASIIHEPSLADPIWITGRCGREMSPSSELYLFLSLLAPMGGQPISSFDARLINEETGTGSLMGSRYRPLFRLMSYGRFGISVALCTLVRDSVSWKWPWCIASSNRSPRIEFGARISVIDPMECQWRISTERREAMERENRDPSVIGEIYYLPGKDTLEATANSLLTDVNYSSPCARARL